MKYKDSIEPVTDNHGEAYIMNTRAKSGTAMRAAIMLLLILTIGQSAIAEQAPVFPKAYELSDADVERYRSIRQRAIDNAPLSWNWGVIQLMQEAAWENDRNEPVSSNEYDGTIDQSSVDDLISEEIAVFLAYAALEDKYGFDENILCFFYPLVIFEMGTVATPLWKVDLLTFDPEEYLDYRMEIDAKTGVVLSCHGPEDAVG
jgi:hypothetical protein